MEVLLLAAIYIIGKCIIEYIQIKSSEKYVKDNMENSKDKI